MSKLTRRKTMARTTNEKLTRRQMLSLMGFGSASIALAACGAAPSAPADPGSTSAGAGATAPAAASAPSKTLSMLSHSSQMTESFRRTGEVFKQKTGITLEITEVPFNDLQPKMMTELLAGTGKYDVLPVTNAMMYPAGQYLEDLSALFTGDLTSDLAPAAIEHSRDLEGTLRALPMVSSMPANFYRTDLIEGKGLKPPTTWAEYVEFCKALTTEASGDTPKVWGSLIEASAKAPQPAVKLVGWFYQNGGAMQDASGNPTINLDQNIEALQFVVDLIHTHKVAAPESAEMTYEDVHNLFMQGRGATAINWQYMVGLANTSEQSVVKNKFAVAPVPAGVAKGVNIDHWVMVVPANSMNKDAALQYLQLAISKEQQLDLLKSEGLVARLSAMNPDDAAVTAINPWVGAWVEQMQWATPQPKWKALGDAFSRLSVAMNSAVTQAQTPKEALDQAQQEIAELVNKG
jgi:multiple sugar transport system substrate-binding protein